MLENLETFDDKAFVDDRSLETELLTFTVSKDKAAGIILIPHSSECKICGSPLLLRADRPSSITLYTESRGTIHATHYHKYCSSWRKGCKTVQYYGYSCAGENILHFDNNWNDLPYLVSSQETAFEMSFLEKYDTELLIGILSYKQKADIYNCQNGYDELKKKGRKKFQCQR